MTPPQDAADYLPTGRNGAQHAKSDIPRASWVGTVLRHRDPGYYKQPLLGTSVEGSEWPPKLRLEHPTARLAPFPLAVGTGKGIRARQ